ncbi:MULTISPECIES: hypothetical protein [Klebsiella pneumoniae complex]|nr:MULTISPECIES: hypothetical protein [Klebsiella]
MKTMFLLGIVFILLVFFQHSDLCQDAAHYLQEMIFYVSHGFVE